ncbi:MAG: nitronate monooxygenase [Bacteroidales bacterium]|nr:nitronate monooxygenase [Bacteroidales bacterium]
MIAKKKNSNLLYNRTTSLFSIEFPIIQAGMIWCSGWRLASAVSNAGGLGLIGAGSMTPEVLEIHIRKCKAATDKPFGVNVPLIYSRVDEQFDVIIREGVKIVFSSAGNPATWTPVLKQHGITVVHVIANVKSALKCEQSGVDAIVAEGFEAGGHNGKEETTTFTLIPLIRQAVKLPLLAAGGIASGRGMLAAMILGADGVQVGSRFVASVESSAHPGFKQKIVEAGDGGTMLALKKVMPVRLLRNPFFRQVQQLEDEGASPEELKGLLGKGRAKLGMFEGDTDEGELEIGQVAALIGNIKPAGDIVREIMAEYMSARQTI